MRHGRAGGGGHCCVAVVETAPGSVLDRCDHGPGGHRLAGDGGQARDGARPVCRERLLHLHRFKHNDEIAFGKDLADRGYVDDALAEADLRLAGREGAAKGCGSRTSASA